MRVDKVCGMITGALLMGVLTADVALGQGTAFGPGSPFYAESALPFHAPAFDRIKDGDYQPAIEAGMAEQRVEMTVIAENPAAATFENTIVQMELSGRLFHRVMAVFGGVTGANTNPALEAVKKAEAPKMAAHRDAIFLDAKLFGRVKAVYEHREALGLKGEDRRLVEVTYEDFVHAGARLSEEEKARLKKLNEEESTLQNAFQTKLLAGTKEGAYRTEDKAALAGMTEAQIGAAEAAAKERGVSGYVVPLQNTTQQPALAQMSVRETRKALYESSWERTERGGEHDTRATIARLAQLRAEKAKLLGYSSYAAWKLEDQMAKTPEAALKFMDALVPGATAKARGEAADIQAVIDTQHGGAEHGGAQKGGSQKGGFQVEPWDWEFYQEQVRKAKYDLDEAAVKPYFELRNVLENGVFYAAHELYGVTFKERKDLPVYQADVRVFQVFDASGKTLALFYQDPFKRDNKNGGAWMGEFVGQTKLLGTIPVVYNVTNFTKPAAGEAALISFDDVTTMFHEFGHALHGIFADTVYPSLSGTSVSRDFVEFPSQFNEHWSTYPAVFAHYAKHYKTGEAMPAELAAKLMRAARFNQGYRLTELLAAAELDMQWHTLAVGLPVQDTDAFEKAALTKTKLAMREVPPRYRTSYFAHIWGGGYAAGYYAYLWAESLDDNAYQWFEDHGGLTRANGDRFRTMVLSRGNTEDLAGIYHSWLGKEPEAAPMLKYRGLAEAGR